MSPWPWPFLNGARRFKLQARGPLADNDKTGQWALFDGWDATTYCGLSALFHVVFTRPEYLFLALGPPGTKPGTVPFNCYSCHRRSPSVMADQIEPLSHHSYHSCGPMDHPTFLYGPRFFIMGSE
jgi:hypothetical protein